jgi:FkbM family methyltransferase
MYSCDARDQVACTAAAKGWNGFEAPMPFYFAHAVKLSEQALVVDVGANTGYYTLLATSVSKSVKVVAYEPLAAVRKVFLSNIKLNKIGGLVRVLPYALSNVSGMCTLFVPDATHGIIETSASVSEGFKDGPGATVTIRRKMLDDVHTGRHRVGVLKVDAESHDLEVLQGAERVLLRDRPIVFVEVLLGADQMGLTRLLTKCRYRDRVLRAEGATAANCRVAHDTLAWNHMWVPEERSDMLAFA